MNSTAIPLLAIAIGYMLGSIPFGLLLTRFAGLGDVRSIGSGNIGATNVLRTGNKGLAAATLLLDTAKGTAAALLAPVLLAGLIGVGAGSAPVSPALPGLGLSLPSIGWLAGFGAVLGHLYPVWLRFNGGKGIATWIGVLFGVHWPAALVFALVWLTTAATTRFSSLASLLAVLGVAAYVGLTAPWPLAVLVAAISALLYWKHAANIRRLLAGTESRIGSEG